MNNITPSRTASARMANAIERAVQRARGERASGGGEESEVTVPQAAVRQCYKGHRNARWEGKRWHHMTKL